jgi:hypothetical protein
MAVFLVSAALFRRWRPIYWTIYPARCIEWIYQPSLPVSGDFARVVIGFGCLWCDLWSKYGIVGGPRIESRGTGSWTRIHSHGWSHFDHGSRGRHCGQLDRCGTCCTPTLACAALMPKRRKLGLIFGALELNDTNAVYILRKAIQGGRRRRVCRS